jgi:hypothetical protein
MRKYRTKGSIEANLSIEDIVSRKFSIRVPTHWFSTSPNTCMNACQGVYRENPSAVILTVVGHLMLN